MLRFVLPKNMYFGINDTNHNAFLLIIIIIIIIIQDNLLNNVTFKIISVWLLKHEELPQCSYFYFRSVFMLFYPVFVGHWRSGILCCTHSHTHTIHISLHTNSHLPVIAFSEHPTKKKAMF